MSHIKFFPNKKTGSSKIYVRIRLGREIDLKQSTNLTLEDAKLWKEDSQSARGRNTSVKILNQRLRQLRTKIEKSIDLAEKEEDKSKRSLDRSWLKKLIQSFNNEEPIEESDLLIPYTDKFINKMRSGSYKQKGVKKNFSEGTIKKYEFFLQNLKDYEAHKKTSFKISDVDEIFAEKFVAYLEETKKQAVNTIGRKIKRLKTIIKQAALDGHKVDPKFNLIKGFEGENIVTFLTFEEIEKLIEAKLSSPKLELARDWFVISCFTALRISDLFRMTRKNIQVIDGGRYITFNQYKTKAPVEVPIHYHVENILNKYGGDFPPNASDNEQSNRSLLARRIKDACEEAKINEVVRGRFNGVIDMYPKHKLICNHSGRRSFCSNFYGKEGWTTPMIMSISGHEEEKNFYKYIDKKDRSLSRQARALFDAMTPKSNPITEEKTHLRKVN